MKSLLTIAAFTAVSFTLLADSFDEIRATKSEKLSRVLIAASERDGKPRLTAYELEEIFGKPDYIETNDVLLSSEKRVYVLTGDRRLHVYLIGDFVSLAGITRKGTRNVVLVWK